MADTVPNRNAPFADQNFDDRVKLVEASFKTVLDADLHEDDKAGRILTAMAFLTTAAAVIYNVAYPFNTPTTARGASLTLLSLNISVLALYLYIFFVLVGAIFYLGALGPSLNKPTKPKEEVPSLLFFHSIASLENEKWSDHWKDHSMKELQEQMVQNYIKECLLIAQKVNAKVTLMSWGSIFFRVAILFFVVLMAALFSPDSGVVGLVFLFGLFGLFFSFAFVSGTLPRQPSQEEPYWRTIISVVWDLIIPGNKSGKFRGSTGFLALLTGLSLVAFLILLNIKFFPISPVALGVVVMILILTWFFVKFISHRKGLKAKARSRTA